RIHIRACAGMAKNLKLWKGGELSIPGRGTGAGARYLFVRPYSCATMARSGRHMRSLAGTALVLALWVSLFAAVDLAELANAAEPDESGAAEKRQTPQQPVSAETICSALAAAAAQNDLPADFFARLIWQESRFDPAAVSRAGAQGVAQFMPATANWRGLCRSCRRRP